MTSRCTMRLPTVSKAFLRPSYTTTGMSRARTVGIRGSIKVNKYKYKDTHIKLGDRMADDEKKVTEMTAEEQKEFFSDATDVWGNEFCTEFIQRCNTVVDDDEKVEKSADDAWKDFKKGVSYYVGVWKKGQVVKSADVRYMKPNGDIVSTPYEWESVEKAVSMVEDMRMLDPTRYDYGIVEDVIDENGKVKRSLYHGQVVQNGYRLVDMDANEPVPTEVVYRGNVQ